MFDIAVLPWPDRKKTGLLIGIGPTFVFPQRRPEVRAKEHGRPDRRSALFIPVFQLCW